MLSHETMDGWYHTMDSCFLSYIHAGWAECPSAHPPLRTHPTSVHEPPDFFLFRCFFLVFSIFLFLFFLLFSIAGIRLSLRLSVQLFWVFRGAGFFPFFLSSNIFPQPHTYFNWIIKNVEQQSLIVWLLYWTGEAWPGSSLSRRRRKMNAWDPCLAQATFPGYKANTPLMPAWLHGYTSRSQIQ